MPGLVKIGRTERQPEVRARELQTTGVPHPFQLEHFIHVSDSVRAESQVHRILQERGVRMSDDREFFVLAPRDAVLVLELIESTVPIVDFSRRHELYELAATIRTPGKAIRDFDQALLVADQLAALARRGCPSLMKEAAHLFDGPAPAGQYFKPLWREYLFLSRQEALRSSGQEARRAVGRETAGYVAICAKHLWLVEDDFEFLTSFLVAGDQFQYEGYMHQLSRYPLPPETSARALDV